MIVESKEEIQEFLNRWNRETSTVIPVWVDLDKHPLNNRISFLYVQFSDDWYVLPFEHNDCKSIEIDLSTSTQRKLVWNKKGLLQTNINIQNIWDIYTQRYFYHNEIIDFDDVFSHLRGFYYGNGIRNNVGSIIPIMKWIEVLGNFCDSIDFEINHNWIDTEMIPILSKVEQQGLRVDRDRFIQKWRNGNKNVIGDIVYTEYNPYAMTSRPSNRHGGVNFSALPKKDGTRSIFIPREGKQFLHFDYSAYHVSIIAKLIGYKLPTHQSPHVWLAGQYACTVDEGKKRTFKIIYGGISDEDKKIPFFKETDDFIQDFYKTAETLGYFSTPKGRIINMVWIPDNNPYKCFSYLLQAMETELNMDVLVKLDKQGLPLPNLYTYDSFLFEVDKNFPMADVMSVLESNGFRINPTYGTDYDKV